MAFIENFVNSLPSKNNDFNSQELISSLKNSGLPTTKWENWKYSPVAKWLPESVSLSDKKFADELILDDCPINFKLLFVNGFLQLERSVLPPGIDISKTPIKEKIKSDDPFVVMNALANSEEISIKINSNCGPMVIVHQSVGNEHQMNCPRLNIEVAKQTEATLVEIFLGQTAQITNAFSQVNLRDGSQLTYYRVQQESLTARHFSTLSAEIGRDAHLNSMTLSLGGIFSRMNLEINLNSPGAFAAVNGLYAGRDSQQHDLFSRIHHHAPHSRSQQLFKGLLDDVSRGIFTGLVKVARDAQKVESSQLNKNLLLAPKAHADSRPQLEVYADDVKCSHGSTVGQLSEDELFYLESRGIPQTRAKQILCHAFLYEVMDQVSDQSLKEWLGNILFESFEKDTLKKLGDLC